MNRTRMIVFAFFALALSGLVAYYAYRMLSNRLAPPTDETVQIVVAAEKLTLGNRLTETQLRVANWPKANLPEGHFSDPNAIVGRGVIVAMSPNEPVLDSKLASKEAGAGLGSAIPEGMRAVAVRVNDIIGVAGFVTPGTHVDVIIIGTPGASGVTTSKIFLENVQVLSAGQNVERDVNGKPQSSQVVTMLVTPEDAQKLALAGDQRIQLALRNPIDLVVENPKGVQMATLYGTSSAAPTPEAPRPRPRPMVVRYAPRPKPEIAAPVSVEPAVRSVTIEVIRGDKRESSTFQMKPKTD
jgi:pilus assembly protein CpaB